MDLILQHGIKRKKNTSTFNVLVLNQNLGGFLPSGLLEDKVSARKQIPDELHMHVHIFLCIYINLLCSACIILHTCLLF